MTWYAYLFEAKSIQAWLTETGRLRDLVGGSELLDDLTSGPLETALESLGLEIGDPDNVQQDGKIYFSRRAGGAFYAFSQNREGMDQFAALWPTVVIHRLPGLNFRTARAEHPESAYEAYLAARRNMSGADPSPVMDLPLGSPLAERTQRTGRPAVDSIKKHGRREPVDAATQIKHEAAEQDSLSSLIRRFAGSDSEASDWPILLEPERKSDDARVLPFTRRPKDPAKRDNREEWKNRDQHRIAVIHADGNGFGQLLMKAGEAVRNNPDQFLKVFSSLSRAISEATEQATQRAVKKTLVEERPPGSCMPARPVVLGGDDLTVIVRADLAIDFTRCFLAEFEKASEKQFSKLKKLIKGLNKGLTAAAGIVYLRANQPFGQAVELAESVVKAVKQQTKAIDRDNPPSALAFYRVGGSLLDDYQALVAQELETEEGGIRYRQTLGSYAIHADQPGLPALEKLLDLQALFEHGHMAKGPARELMTLLTLDRSQAMVRYARWHRILADRQQDGIDLLKPLKDSLEPLLGQQSIRPDELPFSEADEQGICHAPFGDLMALTAMENQLDDKRRKKIDSAILSQASQDQTSREAS
ncbi:hypothetical protein VCB98_09285 [Gammaproteobacteria bacterium AB-CW1]|uniref:Cas10/Cmr2 second palm domain-containing protein n=1 Tax=Natronospira elongata TaxID=3110268 RepID=A0AAP6MLK0_9GAMM|nr:hypothetical protein [Gammaproteobacteria bacterium AB-CW1]